MHKQQMKGITNRRLWGIKDRGQ